MSEIVNVEIRIADKIYKRELLVHDTTRAKLQFALDEALLQISNEINQDFPV